MKNIGLFLLGILLGIAMYQFCSHFEHRYALEDRV